MKNTILRFREFPVYKEARQYRKELKELSREKFPTEENYVLRQQLWRALDSVLFNIAEGSDRHSDKDFSHFLNIALGSVNETAACLDAALDDNYISEDDHKKHLIQAQNLIRQLKAFLAKVRRDNKRY